MAIQQINNGITGAEAADIIYQNDLENQQAIDALELRMPETVPGKNLFNPALVQEGKYQSSGSGSGIVNGEGWACSAFIPVTPGDYYLSSDKGRVGVGLYGPTKTPLRYLGINTGKITVQPGETFLVFNLKSPPLPNWTWAQLERGSVATPYTPYISSQVAKQSVQGLQELETYVGEQQERLTELDVIKTELSLTPNILDPANTRDKVLVSGAGGGETSGTTVTDQYFTTNFIPVTPGQLYSGVREDGLTSTIFRTLAFYNASRVFISGNQNSSNNFTPPAGAAFVKISMPNELHISTPARPDQYAIFEGPAQPFTPYGLVSLVTIDGEQPSNKPDNAVATMGDLRDAAGGGGGQTTGKLKYTQSASVLEILAGENKISFLVGSQRGFTGNNMTNFNNYAMFGAASSNGDDAAPVHIEGHTLGANHGRIHNIANIANHGLDNTAIGTAWLHSNGTTYYPIRIVDANNVAFLSDNTGTFESPVFSAIPVGSISRNGVTLTISNITSTQLYPSIKNLVLKVYDSKGAEIPKQTTGYADFIRIVESYEIMYTPDILANLKARAGQSGAPVFEGRSSCRVDNTYHVTGNLTVIVSQVFEPLLPIAFADTMVTQAIPLNASTATQYYIPNSAPLNAAVDLRKPVAVPWSSSTPGTFVTVANQPDPQNPPNRVAMFNGNAGFLIGYLTDRGVGKSLEEFTARTFEIRNNTGKIYPHPIEGSVVGLIAPVGRAFSSVVYRTWADLSTTRTAQRISWFSFDYDGATYVFADYSASVVDRLDIGRPDLQGKRVEVLEQVNAEVTNDVYGPLVIAANYVEGETSFAVIKIF